MTQTADAVVIGAGINGAATAYHLVRRGHKRVMLLERGLIACGGTGASAAIVRQHYSHPELVRLVRRSVEVLLNFDEQVGGSGGYHRTGWAFLVPPNATDAFDANMAMQQSLGVNTRRITARELHDIEPRIQLGDVGPIAYEPDSGYCDPITTTHAYVTRYCELGGELRTHTPVTGLHHQSGRMTGVQTEDGRIDTPIVVNAAGPWAGRIASWVGIDLPIQVTREQEFILETAPHGGAPVMPFSDFAQAIYYRPCGDGRTLLGCGFPKDYEILPDADRMNPNADGRFIDEVLQRFFVRFPDLRGSLPVLGFSGPYDVTPDWNPIIGPAEQVEGFFLCAGFSGHGFKLGPAVGQCLAELIVDGRCRGVNLGVFGLERFERNELLAGAYGGNRA